LRDMGYVLVVIIKEKTGRWGRFFVARSGCQTVEKNVGEAGKTIPMAAPQKRPKNGRSRARLYEL
ncbi:hypothetical protein, partial [Acinetobacter baumannii]